MRKIFLIFTIVIFVFSSCKKDDTPTVDVPPTPPPVTVNSSWQFSFKIDGNTFAAVDSQQNYTGYYSTSGTVAVYPDTSALIYHSGLRDSLNTNSLQIIKSTLYFASGTIPDSLLFASFFSPRSYNYSNTGGIVIEWYDSNGIKWSTNSGTANQSGSTFVITDIKCSYVNAYLDVRLKVTFNCKLYNSTGQSKTLTNGIYVGSFEAI